MFGFKMNPSEGSAMRQLCAHLRAKVESGELAAGMRMPPTRIAAQELNIARNIIVEVYEQLAAEGYLETRIGSGTFVASGVGERTSLGEEWTFHHLTWEAAFNGSGFRTEEGMIDFTGGTPDLRLFPRKTWGRYLREAVNTMDEQGFDYGDPRGDASLRRVLADYLFRAKGIRANPEQIVIVSGTSEGLLLIASACSDRFRTAYVEDPTIDFIPGVLRRLGYALHPVGVDGQGADIGQIGPNDPPGLLVLTPSHQYPTGSVLSIQRRRQAVRLAEQAGHILVEDDYDSEFRHRGIPIPPLQTLSPSRVIYTSTFSKTLFPAMRLGYLVAPPEMLGLLLNAKMELNLFTQVIPQRALARFIEDGCFDRHAQSMRRVYKKRRLCLTEELGRIFGKDLTVSGDEAGMHIQADFSAVAPRGLNWADAESFGVRVNSFEDYALLKGRYSGKMVLGYGRLNEEEIREGVARLRRFISANGPLK
ncbi:PLP-dependent aminotransferase family protein [Paenibacillus sp. M1]|uniref:PLP-dependent aminotransferase family protein n=1 Tax=Paenibacillus haidiansis TaxID=1574488 RepID=A0ABU7VSG4_9BACL